MTIHEIEQIFLNYGFVESDLSVSRLEIWFKLKQIEERFGKDDILHASFCLLELETKEIYANFFKLKSKTNFKSVEDVESKKFKIEDLKKSTLVKFIEAELKKAKKIEQYERMKLIEEL